MVSRAYRRDIEPSMLTRVAAAGAGLAVVAGLTACGSSGGNKHEQGQDTSALRAVQAAYQKTTTAKSVQTSFEENAQGSKSPAQGQSQKTTASGKGALDYTKKASSIVVHTPGQSDLHTVTIGGIVYQEVPQQQRKQVPGNKPWVKIDQQKVAEAQYGARAAEMKDNPPPDPASILVYLRGATEAKATGTQEVRGTQATRYTTKINIDQAVKGAGPQAEAQAKQLEQQIGTHTLSMPVWLDAQNRVRRLQVSVTPAASGAAKPQAQGGITLSEDFYDYGKPVQVQAPAQDETADVTQQVLQRQQQQQQQPSSPSQH